MKPFRRRRRTADTSSAVTNSAGEADPLLLPTGSRLLHVGPHKTGSTAIQASFQEAGGRLAERGVVYFGRQRTGPAGMSIGVRGAPGFRDRPPAEKWHRLAEDVRNAGDRRVCISNEDFGRAEPEQARRVVDELGGSEPHVVAVVRRLDKLLPSLWQERVKVGSPYRYDEWLRMVLDRPGEPCTWNDEDPWPETERTNLWYAHDTSALVRRWVDAVGSERFTLIVSDDRDRDVLPRTFERLLGLPSGVLALHPDKSNQSLPWGEVEFVRAINEALIARGVPLKKRRRLVGRGLVRDLASRPQAGGPVESPPMPGWAAPVVEHLSATRCEALGSLGVRIVGDPAALRVGELETGDPTAPPSIPGSVAARSVDWLFGELS